MEESTDNDATQFLRFPENGVLVESLCGGDVESRGERG